MISSGGKNLWYVRTPLSIGGVQITTQMTIIKHIENRLMLISPVAITPDLKQEILNIGDVEWIIAPNNFHHLFISSALDAFPNATLLCPEGLPKKLKYLPDEKTFNLDKHKQWGEDVISLRLHPGGVVDEYVFYHSPSNTLVLTDMLILLEKNINTATWVFAFLMGLNSEKPNMSRMMKLLYRDKNKLRESFNTIMNWDFQRIQLAHSRNIEKNAKELFKEAVSFLI